MGAVSTGMVDNFRFKAVAMAVLVLAMCMASWPTIAGQEPKAFCDFYLGHNGRSTWHVIRPKRVGDKMYFNVGRIRHWVNNNGEIVKVANSRSCKYSSCPYCSWQEVKCSHVFYTNKAWVSTRTFNGNDVSGFLNKYIKVVLSAVEYQNGQNYNSNGNAKDCIIFRTGDRFE